MGILNCLLTCCTLILSPNPVLTQLEYKAFQQERQRCRANPKDTKQCLIRIEFKEVTTDDVIYTALCGQENN